MLESRLGGCCVARPNQFTSLLRQFSHNQRSRLSHSTMFSASSCGNAGQVMRDINSLSLTKEDPRLKTVKACIDQAVHCVLGAQRATVQLQGSTSKGTGLPSSDWDFFVRLHSKDDTVTGKERMDICGCLSRRLSEQGIDYCMQPGQNRVRLWAGDDVRGPLPDVDLVFERFKEDERIPPDNKALARSHEAQQVVKYIKMLPYSKTHLPKPKSSLVEQFVMNIYDVLYRTGIPAPLTGATGFNLLLKETLSYIASLGQSAHESPVVRVSVKQILWHDPELKLKTKEWEQFAGALIRSYLNGHGWLRPVVYGS